MALNINGTTGISGVEGSVSAPVLTGTDSNCGISFPSADTIKFSTGGVERMSITNSGVTGTGVGGKVLQYQFVVDTSSASLSNGGTSYTDLGTLSVNITPASTDSKILVLAHVCGSQGSNSTQYSLFFRVLRDSTGLMGVVASGESNNAVSFAFSPKETYSQDGMMSSAFSYVDSPSTTSQITYKVQGACRSPAAWSYNRSYRDYTSRAKGVSTLTLLELAG